MIGNFWTPSVAQNKSNASRGGSPNDLLAPSLFMSSSSVLAFSLKVGPVAVGAAGGADLKNPVADTLALKHAEVGFGMRSRARAPGMLPGATLALLSVGWSVAASLPAFFTMLTTRSTTFPQLFSLTLVA